MKKLDAYNIRILSELDKNSRASASSLSKKLKLPKETVAYRIRNLKSKGYIKSFLTNINGYCLGYQYYLTNMLFSRLDSMTQKRILDFLKKRKDCSNIRNTEGAYDLSFLSTHKNPASMKEFLREFGDLFGDKIAKKQIHTIIRSHRLSQGFDKNMRAKRISSSSQSEQIDIDALDLSILKHIVSDSRIKSMELATLIGKNPRTIAYRIKRMEKNGIIMGYTLAFDMSKHDYKTYQIDFILKDHKYVASMIDYFDMNSNCVFVHELLGPYDLSVELNIKNDESLRELMKEFRNRYLDSYISYDLSHVYEEYNSNLSPFESRRL
jgi:Lrp/AsnC family transcriptional regulator, leucine-responsive regulatory protein